MRGGWGVARKGLCSGVEAVVPLEYQGAWGLGCGGCRTWVCGGGNSALGQPGCVRGPVCGAGVGGVGGAVAIQTPCPSC